MMKRYTLYIMVTALVALVACTRGESFEPCPIIRLDKVMAEVAVSDSAAMAPVIDSLRPEIDAMMAVLSRPAPSWRQLKEWSEGPVVKVFQPDVDSVFPNTEALERQLSWIMGHARLNGMNLPDFTFATVVWGSQRPIVRVDSIVLIALNHYLGSDYPGYRAFSAFKRFDKQPRMLPYDVAAAIVATQYPMITDKPTTLLSWMLYEGALTEAKMRLVENAHLADALGFTDEQIKLLDENSRAIWHEMAAMRMLYDTDPVTIDRMLTAAPNTPLLQGRAPGRTGRYIGYKIVKAYLKKHPDTPLSELFSPGFLLNQKILLESGFNGE